MMPRTQNKVIKASAGTGKTYRLSLEYIGLLLAHARQNVHYSELLVITFTKKATSEIRERIFEHLGHIVKRDEQGKELETNLASILGLRITDAERSYLDQVYRDMLLNKSKVNINTIDAFVNDIFKTIIAPYLGIVNYEIDNNITDEVLAEIYNALTTVKEAKAAQSINDFFFRSGKKTINDYQDFIKSLLYNRWIFDFMADSESAMPGGVEQLPGADELYDLFSRSFQTMLQRFQGIVQVNYPDKSTADLFKADFWRNFIPPADLDKSDFVAVIMNALNKEALSEKYQFLLKLESFWDGSRLFRAKAQKELAEEFKAEFELCRGQLADFIYAQEVVAEQAEIRLISDIVYEKYDEIKFRDKRFTHNDVAYYTFKYLYDPDLSLIDDYAVINTFYEYLTSRTRFVLIDEFQDTSMVQHKILLPIINEITSGLGVKDYGGVIVVGDEKQSIYGWRGGERDLLLAMPKVLPEAAELSLDTSYRSNPLLIDFINKVFADPALSASLPETNWPYDQVKVHSKETAGNIRVITRNFSNTRDDNNDISSADDALREFVMTTLAPLINSENGPLDVKKTAVLARRNSDLEQIAAVLDELGIDYILESSGSILQHRAIAPIMLLYKILVYGDPYDVLCFLRSDLLLLPAEELKTILLWLKNSGSVELSAMFEALGDISAINRLAQILELANEMILNTWPNLLLFTQRVIENFNVTGIFDRENDLVNLNRFLEILSEFGLARRGNELSLKGFLNYCADNEHNEQFQQIGLKEYNAVTLLTIHKSKGLEFDNVFLYWNLGAFTRNNSSQIAYYLDYEQNFNRLRQWVYTLNYQQVIPQTRYSSLVQLFRQREKIEAINTIYVALTRAKNNLYTHFSFRKGGGLSAYVNDIANKSADDIRSDEALLLAVLHNVSHFTEVEQGDNRSVWELGEVTASVTEQPLELTTGSRALTQYIDFGRKTKTPLDADMIQRNEYLDFKSVYVNNRDIDKGNIVHFYLSFVRYAEEAEFEYARRQTLGYFGNLLPVSELDELVSATREFIKKHAELFDRNKWDRVYTEHTIFTSTGRELRMDRMMVDVRSGTVMIIDYKTGELYQPDQLEEYIAAVKDLPVVVRDDYQVIGKYLKLLL